MIVIHLDSCYLLYIFFVVLIAFGINVGSINRGELTTEAVIIVENIMGV